MTEIKLTKRYPQSRTEDIVDAYMRGWNDALDAVQNGKFIINADRKTEPIDKDINVRSKTEPQTNKDFKVTYTCSFTDCDNFKNFGFGEKCIECKRKQSEAKYKDEPQTDEWYTLHTEPQRECEKIVWLKDHGWIEDEPQTEKPKIWKRNDKPFRAVWLDDDHNEIGTPQTERSE